MNISFLFHIDGIPCRYPPYKAREIFKQFGFINNYVSPDDLPNLDSEYGNIQGTTVYGSDVRETNAAVFNGGYVRPDKIAVQSPYLANYQFDLCNLQTFKDSKVPWKQIDTNTWTIPFQGVHASLWESAVAPNLISPSSVYGGNPWEFMLVSDKPAHVHLKGQVSVFVRVKQTVSDQRPVQLGYSEFSVPEATLSLRAQTNVPADLNQDWLLASESGDDLKPMKFRGDKPFIIEQLPYATLKDKLNTSPEYDFSYVRGSMVSGSIDAGWGLDYKGHLMTSWFDLGEETQFIIETDRDNAKTLRIQWLLDDGKVIYDVTQSSATTPTTTDKLNKVINIPSRALRCRLYFSNGDAAEGSEPTTISIKPIPMEYDPYYGMWVRYNFTIDWMGPLHPQINYSFRMAFADRKNIRYDKNGFLITSSVLSMQMNVKDALQTALNIALIDSNIGEDNVDN